MNNSNKEVVSLPGPVHPRTETNADVRLLPLGQQFLEALQSDDIGKFKNCWLSVEQKLSDVKATEPVDWTEQLGAHYQKLFDLEAELVSLHHSMYRSALIKHSSQVQDITLDRVEATTDMRAVSIFVRLPKFGLLKFEFEGAQQVDGRWLLLGTPSSLLEVTETQDGIPEITFARPTSVEMEKDLDRVLGEISDWFEE